MRKVRLATVSIALVTALAVAVAGSAVAKPSKPTVAPENIRGFLLRPNDLSPTSSLAHLRSRGLLCGERSVTSSSSARAERSARADRLVERSLRRQARRGLCRGACDPAGNDCVRSREQLRFGDAGCACHPSRRPHHPRRSVRDLVDPAAARSCPISRCRSAMVHRPAVCALRACPRDHHERPHGVEQLSAFNTRWPSVPQPLPSQPGLVRWTSVSGATGYQVWYPDVQSRSRRTRTSPTSASSTR